MKNENLSTDVARISVKVNIQQNITQLKLLQIFEKLMIKFFHKN